MPTYEYECVACGYEEEIFHSMKEEPRRRCPKCKKLKFRRRIGTGAGLLFKGSGFYETDYKRQSSDAKKTDSDSGKDSAKESPKKETASTADAGGAAKSKKADT